MQTYWSPGHESSVGQPGIEAEPVFPHRLKRTGSIVVNKEVTPDTIWERFRGKRGTLVFKTTDSEVSARQRTILSPEGNVVDREVTIMANPGRRVDIDPDEARASLDLPASAHTDVVTQKLIRNYVIIASGHNDESITPTLLEPAYNYVIQAAGPAATSAELSPERVDDVINLVTAHHAAVFPRPVAPEA